MTLQCILVGSALDILYRVGAGCIPVESKGLSTLYAYPFKGIKRYEGISLKTFNTRHQSMLF